MLTVAMDLGFLKKGGSGGQVLSLQGCGVVLKSTRAAFDSTEAGHSTLGLGEGTALPGKELS